MDVDLTIQQAEAIVRFTEEVDRRLAECGISGTEQLLWLYRQLCDGLAKLSATEIEWASQETLRLKRRLAELETELAHLSALKIAFDVQH